MNSGSYAEWPTDPESFWRKWRGKWECALSPAAIFDRPPMTGS